MLVHLHIRNLAIIEEIDLELKAGMTALTGETGAGKSILVDALGLALGDRADSSVIRHGQERAEITAAFDIGGLQELKAWLADQDLEIRDECLLRRVIGRDGRSRGYINGHPVTMQFLQELGVRLADIHGQHEHQSLLRSETQRELLDDYAGNRVLVAELNEAFRRWNTLTEQLERIERNDSEREARMDLLRYQVRELENIHLAEGETVTLEQEHARLHHSRRLLESSQRTLTALYEEEDSLLSSLSRMRQELESVVKYDVRLGNTIQLLQESTIQLEEAVAELRNYIDKLDLDPARLAWIEERLQHIYELARKYRVPAHELAAHHVLLVKELAQLDGSSETLQNLQTDIATAAERYRTLAAQLSARRVDASYRLAAEVSCHIQQLGMPGGQYAVMLIPRPNGEFSPHGLEQVEFQVSANPGQPLAALARVASGGELSRISLAIQVVAARGVRVPTLIFDEVDVGVGGGTAEIVGRELRALSATHQVLCVTHLPQVAALAQHHLCVSKRSLDDATMTTITPLSGQDRQEEVARMLGGVEITKQTRAHAKEMISRARESEHIGS